MAYVGKLFVSFMFAATLFAGEDRLIRTSAPVMNGPDKMEIHLRDGRFFLRGANRYIPVTDALENALHLACNLSQDPELKSTAWEVYVRNLGYKPAVLSGNPMRVVFSPEGEKVIDLQATFQFDLWDEITQGTEHVLYDLYLTGLLPPAFVSNPWITEAGDFLPQIITAPNPWWKKKFEPDLRMLAETDIRLQINPAYDRGWKGHPEIMGPVPSIPVVPLGNRNSLKSSGRLELFWVELTPLVRFVRNSKAKIEIRVSSTSHFYRAGSPDTRISRLIAIVPESWKDLGEVAIFPRRDDEKLLAEANFPPASEFSSTETGPVARLRALFDHVESLRGVGPTPEPLKATDCRESIKLQWWRRWRIAR
jgi:hypothetical protein